MLANVKNWFMGLKTWQKFAVGFVAFSFLISPFTGNDSTGSTSSTPRPSPSEAVAQSPEATPDPTPPASQAPALTLSQDNAVRKAIAYLDYSAFSKKSLIDQLVYEGYSKADASFAVDYIEVDWLEQAALKAQSYLDYSPFSRQGLIDQLVYEGFTQEEAVYGVNKVGL
jgi:SOS response regulatory protein OraA/RecX